MPYATNRDRPPGHLEIERAPWPAPPLNLILRSGFRPGVFDLWWDDPAQLAVNGRFQLLGVNVYRSFDSEFGPFERITDLPVGSTFWRDQTDIELIPEEDVSGQFTLRGEVSASGTDAPRYVFQTYYKPIVKEGSQNITANYPSDVRVYVDGAEARVWAVFGLTGEVEIDPTMYPEAGKQTLTPAVVPGPDSVVTCSYRRMRSFLKTDLVQRTFYRVTTVGVPLNVDLSTVQPQDLVETPLESAVATSSYEIEKLDWIWREAVRRNRWILEQGGERVKVFMRKNVGLPCSCIDVDTENHQQPRGDCPVCYGTGILGGYEGPYDIIIAPDDGEKRLKQTDKGRAVEHNYEVWTGPSPLLSMRDFIVKQNGERYRIGAVKIPSNRGIILQQHFTIGHIDANDIVQSVPVGLSVKFPGVEFAPSGPEQEAVSETTDRPNIPAEEQMRGRTPAWVNITY